ncbi:FAD-dependent monooxygenase DEP4 [Hyphodiscus hymeniophilus]|uniref:FAD-dependent monooxygenase DEP4 n=1 Tax=Hyphodiscus hymeniophilus TaxID=353542 RepID=A0A9P7B0I2_9HELO|nr:FAD-dependent monooxygenase DEP4 [Hyphodiscus hymeniophilus]
MDSNAAPEHHRVLVVGAGINGLIIAKTYLEIDPSVDVLIIDCEPSLGGVWSKDRIYPGLCYEAPTPLLDFSDMTMAEEFGMEDWTDIPGDRVNEHLVRYATKFDLIKRCRFNVMVQNIEREGLGWKVIVRSIASGCPWTASNESPLQGLTCDKLILATGCTSQPEKPNIDLSSFDGFNLHSSEMGRRYTELTADSVQHVTVVGGHKSALEAVGTAAQAGKKVEWIMRVKGGGPTWMFPSRGPDGSSLQKLSTLRVLSVIGLSVYDYGSRLNRFLHSGQWWLGTYLTAWFWAYMTKSLKGDKYTKSETGRKLEPSLDSTFWCVPGGTITQERDLETLRLVDEEKLIRINRAHIVSAQGRSVTFDTGITIETDGIVWCTGWGLSNNPLVTASLANELGLPMQQCQVSTSEKEYWEALETEAGDRLLDLYKVLREPPENAVPNALTITPYRLFRQIIPPKLAARGDNSVVLIGNYSNGPVQLTGEIVSLFAVAYLEDMLPPATTALLRNTEAMHKDIAMIDAFRRKRYLGFTPYRVAVLEWTEHVDRLMADLGLRADRKRLHTPGGWKGWFGLKAWYREWFEGYFGSDYNGIVQEFLLGVEQRRDIGCGKANATSVDEFKNA